MTADEYLTECGWQQSGSGWEHPSEPGVVHDVANALIEQGGKGRPGRSWATSRFTGSSRPAPDLWEGVFENER